MLHTKMSVKLAALAGAGALACGFAVAPTVSAADDPTITVTPLSVYGTETQSEPFTVSGTGCIMDFDDPSVEFRAGAYADHTSPINYFSPTAVHSETVQVAADGTWSVELVLPKGVWHIGASCGAISDIGGGILFYYGESTVVAVIDVTVSSGGQDDEFVSNQELTITADAFAAGEDVVITVNGVALATVQADAAGLVAWAGTLPSDLQDIVRYDFVLTGARSNWSVTASYTSAPGEPAAPAAPDVPAPVVADDEMPGNSSDVL